jgi:hypothetical protein
LRQIICDGCKNAEELKGEAKAGRDIKQVRVSIVEDEREKMTPPIPISADLCGSCQVEMLNKYFRQEIDNREALMPESLRHDYIPPEERELEETHAS